MMVSKLWEASRPLTFTGFAMLIVFGLSGLGMLLDPRIITGAPAWLKPAKFAISFAIYLLTLAWILTYLPDWPRLRRWAGWITAIVSVVEVAIIDLQVWRGTTSHFNNATPLDTGLFAAMGIAILAAWAGLIAVSAALFRARIRNAPMAWALRLGVPITILGSAIGGMMIRPGEAQVAAGRPSIGGAHTVGAPDGGPGIPGTGWSREHGDLRVPHFFGLHAMQALPLLTLLFAVRRPAIVIAGGIAYTALVVVLAAQALAGRPFLGGML